MLLSRSFLFEISTKSVYILETQVDSVTLVSFFYSIIVVIKFWTAWENSQPLSVIVVIILHNLFLVIIVWFIKFFFSVYIFSSNIHNWWHEWNQRLVYLGTSDWIPAPPMSLWCMFFFNEKYVYAHFYLSLGGLNFNSFISFTV